MMVAKRLLAGAGAVAFFAGAAVIGISVPAQAAGQTITVTPNTNLKGGQVVTVTYSGYTPNGPIAVGVCAPPPRKVVGPGDCGGSKLGYSKLTTANATGGGSVQITVPEGALGNTTPPSVKCPPCIMGATNIAKGSETASVLLGYAKAGGTKAAVVKTTTTKTVVAKPLAPTGPREAFIYGIAAFVVLQIGLVLYVRASRAAPRRSAV